METEIEAKFLNVDHAAMRKRLKDAGAELVKPHRVMKRANFDYPDKRLNEIGGWIRVRDEGDKITLAYKQLNDRTLHGTKEVEVVVSDFENACKFLTSIGMEQKTYQETKRESWLLDGVQVELDEWPWVRPYMELEAADEATLKAACQKLGLDWNDAVHGSVEIVYTTEYDVTDDEVNDIDDAVFKPVPDWLEARRKVAA